MSKVHYFGIRHHGPGCARSLVQALDALQPDCVLVEGPPEADGVISHMLAEDMRPPVAMLTYCKDDAALATFHPLAEFSPEWQALLWAQQQGKAVQFMDLPMTHWLALQQEEKARLEQAQEAETAEAAADDADDAKAETEGDTAGEIQTEPDVEATDAASVAEEESSAVDRDAVDVRDPLSYLAQADGYADGESWWNHMVEERTDSSQLFAAIEEAMVALRDELSSDLNEQERSSRSAFEQRIEALREAHMRKVIRTAEKQGYERIAVVCGAWHLGGLKEKVTIRHDNALLKGLPKVKVECTWIPWSNRRLCSASGYGAGIDSPGWYEHLWQSGAAGAPAHTRSVGWLTRIAKLMRARDLDCSSAHLIETVRLAQSLAALRARPSVGLDELQEAATTVLTMGDASVLQYLAEDILIGDKLGSVPADVPTVPLQKDVEGLQKSLRLKPKASQETLDLDLRKPNGLQRSYLLHRLNMLGVHWGEVQRTGSSAKGTFHEIWGLQWQPEFWLHVIEASRWGQTLEGAATAFAVDKAQKSEDMEELAQLVDAVLLADLQRAVPAVTQALEKVAADSSDTAALLGTLPALANVFRYGNVRQTDTASIATVLDGLIVRASIALLLGCSQVDDEVAQELHRKIGRAHHAVNLRNQPETTEAWHGALQRVAGGSTAHHRLQGLTTRLLLDAQVWDAGKAADYLSLHLSSATPPVDAAAWLDGFLNRNAAVLLHDARLWQLVDEWVSGLGNGHFISVLPMVRRTFSEFEAAERRDIAQHVKSTEKTGKTGKAGSAGAGGSDRSGTTANGADVTWDAALAVLPLPTLRKIMGVE